MPGFEHDADQRTVQDVVNLHKAGQLNLSPGFQRNSVWNERDRAKLIDSIIRNYPLPAIFLYRRRDDGNIVYDVIDGKQRLESILMYMGIIRGKRFEARLRLPPDEHSDWYDWRALRKRKQQHLLNGYKLRTIEVDGDPADVIDLFVRINSTGKALTAAEKRHARYFNSEFLRTAGKIGEKFERYLLKGRTLTAGQISRMKHVELMCELMLSIYTGDVTNKKAALDSIMEKGSVTTAQIRKCKAKAITAVNRVRRMFPKLHQTRFSKLSDFYTLVVLMAKFEAEKLILTDRRRNRLAWELLVAFSNGVDSVAEKQKKLSGVKPNEEVYREYLLTVLQGTDDMEQRRKREQILRGILQSLFEKKDERRMFTGEQRRILWNSSASRKCQTCNKQLSWTDFTIDHIDPYSKGGRTRLQNAALMCRKHNSAKGNRKAS